MCKKNIFPMASSGDLLLNEKQKKPFVSLKDEVTIIHIERKSSKRFIFVSLGLNCRFYSPQSGVDRYFSWNCDVGF